MKFKITHQTSYLFSEDVFLEPHYLRFRPRQSNYTNVTHFDLSVDASQVQLRHSEDEEHNFIDFCWFSGPTSKLLIQAETHIESLSYNPYNFLVYPEAFNRLPFDYSKQQKLALCATLKPLLLPEALIDFANQILVASQYDTISFLSALTIHIHKEFSVEYREIGSPLAPESTFTSKKGSCRDLSWMQINLLRHFGIAARFVSGYFYFEMDAPVYELHAWVEVFIPGSGWIGLDPSHGILTGSTHFAMAASAMPENTMPVSGNIRGSASSKMLTQLVIEQY